MCQKHKQKHLDSYYCDKIMSDDKKPSIQDIVTTSILSVITLIGFFTVTYLIIRLWTKRESREYYTILTFLFLDLTLLARTLNILFLLEGID